MNNDTTIEPVQISDIIKGFDFCDFKYALTEQGAPSMEGVGKVMENIFKACGVAFTKEVEAMKDEDGSVLCNTYVYNAANFTEKGMKFLAVLSSLEGEGVSADTLDTISFGWRYDTDLIADAVNNAPCRNKDDKAFESKTRCYDPFLFSITKYIKERMETDGEDEEGLRAMIEVDHIITLILCGIYTSLRRMAVIDIQNQVVKLVNMLGGGLDLLPPNHINSMIEESLDSIRKKAGEILANAKEKPEASE